METLVSTATRGTTHGLVTNAAKAHLVERIMALVGRSEPDPRAYRDHLETLSLPELQSQLNRLMEQYDL